LFKGHFRHSIDAKGRIAIPARLKKYFKPEAENSVVMTKGIGMDNVGHCVDVYPKDSWTEVESKLQKLNPYNKNEQRFIRTILYNAQEETMDNQSRVLIPQHLIQHAGLDGEVLVIGVLDKIEIWNPETYEKYNQASPQSFEDIAETVMREL